VESVRISERQRSAGSLTVHLRPQHSPPSRHFDAPEWTRTTTDHRVHKALNPVRKLTMRVDASKAFTLSGLLRALDAVDGTDVAKMLPRISLARTEIYPLQIIWRPTSL
jgi:hypothetical protein